MKTLYIILVLVSGVAYAEEDVRPVAQGTTIEDVAVLFFDSDDDADDDNYEGPGPESEFGEDNDNDYERPNSEYDSDRRSDDDNGDDVNEHPDEDIDD